MIQDSLKVQKREEVSFFETNATISAEENSSLSEVDLKQPIKTQNIGEVPNINVIATSKNKSIEVKNENDKGALKTKVRGNIPLLEKKKSFLAAGESVPLREKQPIKTQNIDEVTKVDLISTSKNHDM